MRLEVSIDQSECTSCAQCPDIAPQHFFMGNDAYAYVQENHDGDPSDPKFKEMGNGVLVAAGLEENVIEAAEICPGECIYVDAVNDQ